MYSRKFVELVATGLATYPKAGGHGRSQMETTLFTARLVKDPNDTLIFGRAIGMAHVDGRDDATAAEIDARHGKRNGRTTSVCTTASSSRAHWRTVSTQ